MMNAGRDASPGRRMCFFQAREALLNSVEGKPMIRTEAGGSSRREFLGSAGKTVAASALAGWRSRWCMPGRATRSSSPWWVAAAAAPAQRPMHCPPRAVPSSWSPWPTSFGQARARGSTRAMNGPAMPVAATQVDVPPDRRFIGFDAYKKAMDCLQAGRRRHLHHAPRLPLGAFRLRHREGPQRLHGEADRPSTAPAPGRCWRWPSGRHRRTSRWASA